jgi:hypothetical protein
VRKLRIADVDGFSTAAGYWINERATVPGKACGMDAIESVDDILNAV